MSRPPISPAFLRARPYHENQKTNVVGFAHHLEFIPNEELAKCVIEKVNDALQPLLNNTDMVEVCLKRDVFHAPDRPDEIRLQFVVLIKPKVEVVEGNH